jgi:hypothetical protein
MSDFDFRQPGLDPLRAAAKPPGAWICPRYGVALNARSASPPPAVVVLAVAGPRRTRLRREYGESGVIAVLEPATIDRLVYESSMVMLDSARRGVHVPALARWLLGLGLVATLAVNVAHGLGYGVIGVAIGAWPVVALVGKAATTAPTGPRVTLTVSL